MGYLMRASPITRMSSVDPDQRVLSGLYCSFNSVQLTERTRNCIYLHYKGDNLKNIYARVMVLVHDTSSQCALQMYEVSLKYL